MSERYCIRECTIRGAHYATCPEYGKPSETASCRGCAPRACRDGSLICDRCFGRMRALLSDTRDLIGRLYSLADPMKATPTDQLRVASSSTEPPAPVGADLLDAIAALEPVFEWAFVDLADYTNDLETMTWLCSAVLERHREDDGIRSTWSVQDAVDKWGVERRDRSPDEWVDDEDDEIVFDRPEWGDPLLNKSDAEKLAGSARTLRRWRKKELIAPAGTIYIAGVRTDLYRRSDLLEVREQQRQKVGRPRTTDHEIWRQP